MKPIYINININCFKETPYARKLRIAETENGRKLRGRIIEAKKKYKRSREIPDFDFFKENIYKTLATIFIMYYIFPYIMERMAHIIKFFEMYIATSCHSPRMRSYDKKGSGVCR